MEGWMEGWMPFSRGAGFSGHTNMEEWRESTLGSEALASPSPAHPAGVSSGALLWSLWAPGSSMRVGAVSPGLFPHTHQHVQSSFQSMWMHALSRVPPRSSPGLYPPRGPQHGSQERGLPCPRLQSKQMEKIWARELNRIPHSPAQASSTDCTVHRGGHRFRGHRNVDATPPRQPQAR